MSFKRSSLSGVGSGNAKFPIWDYGCQFYWIPDFKGGDLTGKFTQRRGGVVDSQPTAAVAAGGVIHLFNDGRGQFTPYNYNGVNPWACPPDGRFNPNRTNYWNNNTASDRGATYEPGLTSLATSMVSNHIVEESGTYGPTDIRQVGNSTGADRVIYRDETTSAAFSRWFSVLVKMVGGSGVIDNTVVVPAVWDPADGYSYALSDISANHYYKKIRGDGWYEVGCSIPTQALTPTKRVGFVLKTGYTVLMDMPQWESVGTSMEEGSDRIRTTGFSQTREWGTPPGFARADTLQSALPRCGWMGITIIPRWPITGVGSKTYPTSICAEVVNATGGADTDSLRYYFSNALQEFTFQAQVGGVTQAYLQVPQAVIQEGVPLGVVVAWGLRKGTKYYQMAYNGTFGEVVTSGDLPPKTVTDAYYGYGGEAASDPLAQPANCLVQRVALGDSAMHRNDTRALSKWFQRRAFSTIG